MNDILKHILPTGLMVLLIFMQTCTEIEDAEVPGRPLMVHKNAGSLIDDRGISTLPDFNAVKIQWYRGMENDLNSYIIYRAIDTSTTSPELEFSILDTHYLYSFNPNIADTEYVDYSPLLGEMHYYFIRARDDADNLSSPGDTVRYQPDVKPFIDSPNGSELSDQPVTFTWKYSADFKYAVDYFIIRVENVSRNQLIWSRGISRSQYDGHEQSLSYNDDGTALENRLTSLDTYRWRLDAVGRFNSDGISEEGSMSSWIEFNVKE